LAATSIKPRGCRGGPAKCPGSTHPGKSGARTAGNTHRATNSSRWSKTWQATPQRRASGVQLSRSLAARHPNRTRRSRLVLLLQPADGHRGVESPEYARRSFMRGRLPESRKNVQGLLTQRHHVTTWPAQGRIRRRARIAACRDVEQIVHAERAVHVRHQEGCALVEAMPHPTLEGIARIGALSCRRCRRKRRARTAGVWH